MSPAVHCPQCSTAMIVEETECHCPGCGLLFPDLGACCGCRRDLEDDVVCRTLICLDRRAPMPGRGWACEVCDLPPDGAIVVLCDECAVIARSGHGEILRDACAGWPRTDGRVLFDSLTEPFAHALEKHPSHEWVCRGCGCTEQRACRDPQTGGPCCWVEPCLCSSCAT